MGNNANGNLTGKLGIFLFGVAVGYFLSELKKYDDTVIPVPIFRENGMTTSSPKSIHRHSEIPSKSISMDDGTTLISSGENVGDTLSQKTGGPRKILLDCGANVASTVQLFRETYPDGRDYIIHSFELDERLAPYFASYYNHVLHCPLAVGGEDGNITAYAESAWKPDKGTVAGKDMQWGGGAIYASDQEKESEASGRRFGVRNVIPMVDLSSWIQTNTAVEDYVIFKLDVEGAEYPILEKMLKDGTFQWVDKFYGEFHEWFDVPGWSHERKNKLIDTLKTHGVNMLSWAGEHKTYQDLEDLNKPNIPKSTPGVAGTVYSKCSQTPAGSSRLALAVQVGMNRKAAFKLVETIRAHPSKMPVTLFVYGDFVQDFPDLITKWSDRYTIGIREGAPFPAGHWVLQNGYVMAMSLVSSVQRMSEVSLNPVYYYPDGLSQRVQHVAKNRGLRIIQPTTQFPPNLGTLLVEDNYYNYRDVERTPKALRILYERISKGGILSLNSDHPDSYMISAFLMDYLYENSGFELVSMENCLK